MTGATLVVGLGRSDRGDDGVGPEVARLVETRLGGDSDVQVLVEEEPTALLDLWEDHDHVVVVDAVVTGGRVGTVHRFELGADAAPLPEAVRAKAGRAGTHAFGLAAVTELGRALHRLPARVVVVGVEAASLDVGAGLSPPVAGAVEAAAEVVWAEVTAHVPGRAG
jgi:hydrogenase maturation protease